jgi:hypothetical protein
LKLLVRRGSLISEFGLATAGGRIVKLNKGGLKLCAVYLCYFALMTVLELMARGKGTFFFGSLSILPFGIVLMLLEFVGLGDVTMRFFESHDLLNTGLFTVPVSFLLVYLTGWAVNAFARAAKAVRPGPSMPVVDPPGWSDRR